MGDTQGFVISAVPSASSRCSGLRLGQVPAQVSRVKPGTQGGITARRVKGRQAGQFVFRFRTFAEGHRKGSRRTFWLLTGGHCRHVTLSVGQTALLGTLPRPSSHFGNRVSRGKFSAWSDRVVLASRRRSLRLANEASRGRGVQPRTPIYLPAVQKIHRAKMSMSTRSVLRLPSSSISSASMCSTRTSPLNRSWSPIGSGSSSSLHSRFTGHSAIRGGLTLWAGSGVSPVRAFCGAVS